jgi:hypothetical protein
MAEKIPSSVRLGVRLIKALMRSYSSAVRPCAAASAGVTLASRPAAAALWRFAAAALRIAPAPETGLLAGDLRTRLRTPVEGLLAALALVALAIGSQDVVGGRIPQVRACL